MRSKAKSLEQAVRHLFKTFKDYVGADENTATTDEADTSALRGKV